PPRRSTLFPYTTLFRSAVNGPNQGRRRPGGFAVGQLKRVTARVRCDDGKGRVGRRGRSRLVDHHANGVDVKLQTVVVGHDERVRSEEHTSELQSQSNIV